MGGPSPSRALVGSQVWKLAVNPTRVLSLAGTPPVAGEGVVPTNERTRYVIHCSRSNPPGRQGGGAGARVAQVEGSRPARADAQRVEQRGVESRRGCCVAGRQPAVA